MRIFFGAGPATFAPAECVCLFLNEFVCSDRNLDRVAVGGRKRADGWWAPMCVNSNVVCMCETEQVNTTCSYRLGAMSRPEHRYV